MGFVDRAIRRGVRDTVGNAVREEVEPAATNLVNKAAGAIDGAAQNAEQQVVRSSSLEGAMANLERTVQGYANEAAKNTKFCSDCGAKLPAA